MPDLLATLPFSGFYNSIWSDGIDRELEQFVEHFAEYDQAEEGIPPELRLSESELGDFAWEHVAYSEAYSLVAQEYAAAFGALLSEAVGLDCDLLFESMSSPRFYNFETDRIFAHIPESVARKLFALSGEHDGHAALAALVRERFTSRDGFSSFYPNDLADWPSDVSEWDHNQIGTLIEATIQEHAHERDIEHTIYEQVEFYSAFDQAMNFVAFEEKCETLRAERLAEFRETDPEYSPPYRCKLTPDLFASV